MLKLKTVNVAIFQRHRRLYRLYLHFTTFHHFFYTTALSHQHFATKLVETDELMIQINCANKFDVILVIDCVQLREMRRSFNMGVGKFPFEHQI